ncbi:MAG TPA: AMP-dependent synthetase, partial [Gammaproteobacteria bacterium]|nr:AMP-dependent synthetase [Gammaproteobacteria bacterium]
MNNLLQLLTKRTRGGEAIAAPNRDPQTYALLSEQILRAGGELRSIAIEPNSRVAMVLPNGPLMASAFVSLAPWCTTAPLNPAYKSDEFEFYLQDLEASVLMVETGSESGAIEVAHRLGIRVIEIEEGEEAGSFSVGEARDEVPAREEDAIALILHTSGTTSRPKMVPLSLGNLAASASNIAATLQLSGADRCLNVMPLFHIHGLMAPVLASLISGASVYCTPGFDALRFFAWLDDARPSWYSAVPTMHQGILSRAPRN